MEIIDELMTKTHTFANISSELAQKAGQYTKKVEVPARYQQYACVFSEEASQWFPPSQPWDHAIGLKEGTPSAKYIPPLPPRKSPLKSGSKISSGKVTFKSRSPLMHPLSSSRKRMANYAWSKIIVS